MGGVGSPTSSEFHFTDDKSPPPGSFLAAILVELKLECMRSPKAWLFSALRVLSKGIYIPKEGSLLDRVEKLLDRIRENKMSY